MATQIDTMGSVPQAGVGLSVQPDPGLQGRAMLDAATRGNLRDVTKLDAQLDTLATKDPAAAAAARATIMKALSPVEQGQLLAIADKQAPDQAAGARVAELASPTGGLAGVVQNALGTLAKSPELAKTEWGQRLQTVLTTGSTIAAFQAGLNDGLANGAKDMVVSLGTFVGKTVQYGVDVGLAGHAMDGLRSLLPNGAQAWMKDQALIPSAQRGAATTDKLVGTATAIKDYVANKTPGQVGNDIAAVIQKSWKGLEADHAKAAAQGPAAEARWFGQVTGRVAFEVAATFVPVAGVAGKVTKGVQVTEKVADGVRLGERVVEGARAAQGVRALISMEHAGTVLRAAAKTDLAALRAAGLSNAKLGPAISVVMDRATGKVSRLFYNNSTGAVPAQLNKVLADRLGPAKLVDYVKTHGAGSHSEIYAVNEMLNNGSKLENLAVYTEGTKGALAGTVKPPCPHCNVLLQGVTYVP